MQKEVIFTEHAPKAIGPYVQAIKADGMIFGSGQLGLDPATGKMVEGGAAKQAEQAMKNIGSVLRQAGLDYGNIVKTTIFLKDLGDFSAVNEAYGSFFQGNFPARSCFQVAKLPLDGLVEIEYIAIP